MQASRFFLRLNWFTLIFIFLVIIAGSFVRVSGSGMGCPDWPKCFGQWIPPTTDAHLPKDYKDVYSKKREKKIVKFANFIEKIGFSAEATQLRDNKALLIEQEFNARKTWTEYINRLVGVLAGFGVLFVFLGTVFKYRKRKWMVLSTVNLIVLIIQAWFGSIVVATNLVPWTITVHMLLALVIVALQLHLLAEMYKSRQQEGTFYLPIDRKTAIIVWIVLLITFIQMFLGTQVREYIDVLTKQGFGRETWTDKLGMSFFIHRSFSWLVLVLLAVLTWFNYKGKNYTLLHAAFSVLAIELTSGVVLAYADMLGLVQTAHLFFACILFGILYYSVLKFRIKTQ